MGVKEETLMKDEEHSSEDAEKLNATELLR